MSEEHFCPSRACPASARVASSSCADALSCATDGKGRRRCRASRGARASQPQNAYPGVRAPRGTPRPRDPPNSLSGAWSACSRPRCADGRFDLYLEGRPGRSFWRVGKHRVTVARFGRCNLPTREVVGRDHGRSKSPSSSGKVCVPVPPKSARLLRRAGVTASGRRRARPKFGKWSRAGRGRDLATREVALDEITKIEKSGAFLPKCVLPRPNPPPPPDLEGAISRPARLRWTRSRKIEKSGAFSCPSVCPPPSQIRRPLCPGGYAAPRQHVTPSKFG